MTMEKTKTTRKTIATQIAASIGKTVEGIDKAKQGKKLKKLIARASKKIADRVAEQLKRGEKKQRKSKKSMETLEGALAGKSKKSKKS